MDDEPLLSTAARSEKHDEDSHSSVFNKRFFVGDKEITVRENYHKGFCGCLWNAGELLSVYIGENAVSLGLQDAQCIELGCGIGLTGIALAQSGAKILLTDLPYAGELVTDNLKHNVPELLAANRCRFQDYEWGDVSAETKAKLPFPFRYIFLADCIYDTELVPPLVSSLLFLSNEQTEIFICYEWRLCDAIPLFWKAVEKYFTHKKVDNATFEYYETKWRPRDGEEEGMFILKRNSFTDYRTNYCHGAF
eukprot:TRINITY_DN60912_c0_g1_i1.p1 TRINITY_DN60912_c0_g1~~TRINITY_DN60912_c0_g1_i1.p1  ORF type:complete len:257 (+),score=3.97 TRINITY_DN60912_c0_g1_i1:24-773(+)